MRTEQESRPACEIRAARELDGDETSSSPSILADVDAIAERVRGRLVVQVAIADDKYRTHVYRSTGAAERAVERARKRGKRAHVTLVQLLPIGVVTELTSGGDAR